jgi:hypothetical protein
MKRVIDGKTYNTDTATLVARYQYVGDRNRDTEANVYLTPGGAFFILHSWDDGGREKNYMETITRDDLVSFMANATKDDNFDIIDEAALTPPPEAEAEAEPSATVYVRVPASLKKRVDEAASEAKLSGNSYMLRCMEECLKDLSDYKPLFRIWDIASTFRAHADGGWREEKCVEALSEIANLAEELTEELFPGRKADQILSDGMTTFEVEAQDVRDRYRPYAEG